MCSEADQFVRRTGHVLESGRTWIYGKVPEGKLPRSAGRSAVVADVVEEKANGIKNATTQQYDRIFRAAGGVQETEVPHWSMQYAARRMFFVRVWKRTLTKTLSVVEKDNGNVWNPPMMCRPSGWMQGELGFVTKMKRTLRTIQKAVAAWQE